ncbi:MULTISPECIES: DUF2141 domain-containing protein [Sphingomonas]|uniref:DUF2141 domain-containing protein n=1 Tax=Sphingomonas TaxID=13687 RepID=UPI000DEED38A|nr:MULTISPECIES: DUF2141 domain-containing protein [Sphingomonas]
MIRLALLAAAAFVSSAATGPGVSELTVKLDGLRNAKGVVHVCLTGDAQRFLDCQKVPGSVGRTVPAGQAARVVLGRVPAGTYALLVIHDENANGKLDMTFGIPREGFGFSTNPAMRPRPPRWDEIRFVLPAGTVTETIRMRYVL